MMIAEREGTVVVPDWAVAFLRDRCSWLQRQLVGPADPIFAVEEEESIVTWLRLLVELGDLPDTTRQHLEDLHVLHARVAERLERGGVADISEDVDTMVRALLIDQLQQRTDQVVDLLS
jgi:hypothetical protein